jgi:hypothetical protein
MSTPAATAAPVVPLVPRYAAELPMEAEAGRWLLWPNS